MITEDYCSYEVSKLLKEKGFYQDCYSYPVYWMNGKNPVLSFEGNDDFPYEQNEACAPSQSVAMKWLREVHNIYIMIDKDFATTNGWHYFITTKDMWENNVDKSVQQESNNYTYEEACEASIKYCLENLI